MILQHATFEPVPRPRVMELLARAGRRRIGLVVAPAGYGKSVAVAHYLLGAGSPSVWFVVRDEHTKLLGFAWGLARALAREAPSLERGLLGAYQSVAAGAETPVALAAWFAGQLDDCSQTIVVDNVHLALEEPSVRNFIVALIERASGALRWLLLGRSALDLPMATWLAYGHADEPIGEDDLRIRSDEAAAIASACDVALSAARIEELVALTAGWPAAFIFALRAAAGGTELGQIAVETREKLYAYLADQAFAVLSPSDQQFLLETALLPVIDLELLAASGWNAPAATYTRLRRHAGFVVPDSATTFHYHDLFRDFLQHRLRLKGAAAYRRAQLASADLAEAAGRQDVALRLRVAAEDRAGVVRMLRDRASSPTFNGIVDAVEEALQSLPQDTLRRDAELLGLLAYTRDFRNLREEAATLYRAAIDVAESADQRGKLTLLYARSLHLRGAHEAEFEVLTAVDVRKIDDFATRSRLLSRLAVLRVMRREFEEAQRLMTDVLASTVLGEPELRASVVYDACLVSYFSNRLAELRSRLRDAVKASEQSGNDAFMARCCHFSSVLAINDGDWQGAARLLDDMLVLAKREGDLALVGHALQTMLGLAVLSGDGAAALAAEAALGHAPGAHLDSRSARSFARAMAHARGGDFQAARREAEDGLPFSAAADQLDRMLYCAELAIYQAALGDHDATLGTIARATTLLAEHTAGGTPGPSATIVNITRVQLAVAQALSRRPRAANDILSQFDQSDSKAIPAVKSIVQAARTFNQVAQGVAEPDALDRDLASVREAGLGGFADLLAVLPVQISGSAAAFGTLTKTEMQMLRLIARGGTMKAIALGLNRSPDTVETHIRAILRKLGCKSRNEAVALARDRGIV